jgi:exonuclease VII small subunit
MTQEQTFFYLFSEDNDKGIEILELTTVEALEMWERGRHWLDMPQQTLSEAEQLKIQLLASGRR